MNDYRKKLYENYSQNFGEAKAYDYEQQAHVFEGTYLDFNKVEKSAKILDLGCGKGEWLQWLRGRNYSDLTGVDVCAGELDYLREKGIKAVCADVFDFLENCSEKFDVIHAKDLFEHFTKDEAVLFLEKIYKLLNQGGEVWILTFNAQCLFSSVTYHGDFTHELAVTPTSMAQVLRAVDFEVLSVKGNLPASSGIRGKIRKLVFYFLAKLSRFIITLRHGKIPRQTGVDVSSALPDMIAIGVKK